MVDAELINKEMLHVGTMHNLFWGSKWLGHSRTQQAEDNQWANL
jgi:hypothetical protein